MSRETMTVGYLRMRAGQLMDKLEASDQFDHVDVAIVELILRGDLGYDVVTDLLEISPQGKLRLG